MVQHSNTLDRLKSRKGLTRKIPVIVDGEVLAEFDEAKIENDLLASPAVLARTSAEAQVAVRERYAAAEQALKDATVLISLRRPVVTYEEELPNGDTIERTLKGRLAFEYLLEKHPGTDEQNAEHQKVHGVDAPYDGDTFCPALIAACSEDPVMTAEECDSLMEEWTLAEVMQIFTACMDISNASLVGQMGKGSGGTGGF